MGFVNPPGIPNPAPKVPLVDQGSDPTAPSGEHVVYSKSDGVHIVDHAAVVLGPLGSMEVTDGGSVDVLGVIELHIVF
jgi:hypothetical protein